MFVFNCTMITILYVTLIADVEVQTFTESANAIIYQSVATTLSFSTTITTNGPDDILASTGL